MRASLRLGVAMHATRRAAAGALRGGAVLLPALVASGCRDLSSFTSSPHDRYEGRVVDADFVRSGVDVGTSLCLTLDAEHLQDTPGVISTSDGRFHAVPLRPIPQVWHDPLSTISFGEGRIKNLIYIATATMTFGDNQADDTVAFVSLMQSGGVEVRLVRGAPSAAEPPQMGPSVADDGGAPAAAPSLFAVFPLTRQTGPCSY
jgi:hypothetical protein